MTYRKKLIEVALPLEAINQASQHEKDVHTGHPANLHAWWARRPLAACRAILFSSIVDDPGDEVERQRLFRIIEELVKWENSNNHDLLEKVREEIMKATSGNPPAVLDPFCGRGSVPLEGQRLGLSAFASDLNPVAVLITKALIEIPPKFAGKPPVHPTTDGNLIETRWHGAAGLVEDVRYYGRWMRAEAEKRIGHLYPKIKLPRAYGGGDATVIAWIWTRIVKCPNPACGATMPLVRSFWLSTHKGHEAWVEPVVDKKRKSVRFEVKTGKGTPPDGTVNRQGATCIVCKSPVPFDHIRFECKKGRMATRLMAVVAEIQRGRVYLSPTPEHEAVAEKAKPKDPPDTDLPERALGFRVQRYGMTKHKDLFTPRQLAALTTFSDLVGEAREHVMADARKAEMSDNGGTGARAYAEAIQVYLAFALDRLAQTNCSLIRWLLRKSGPSKGTPALDKQALPMVWDFSEGNVFGGSVGSWDKAVENVLTSFSNLTSDVCAGSVHQADASNLSLGECKFIVCTDPPYYDNIGYADLSDFFYVWLRRSLKNVYPDLFGTVLVPKVEELVATPFRFGGDKEKAQKFFETGFGVVFSKLREIQHPDYPLTVFYAFKQSEDEGDNDESTENGTTIASTGWETMLEGLLKSGFAIYGTWPMRTESRNRIVAIGTNALASSIVLVCRPRPENALTISRRDFIHVLKQELPSALKNLEHSNIAPVDFAQAAIGPGMAIFSQYAKIIEADGTPMSVRTALQIINQELDAYLASQEGDMDTDTRFCLAWFEQFGMAEGLFGEADVLARAKNTSVQGLVDAGCLLSRAGKVRILKRDEYDAEWDPAEDDRLTVWECTQHLIKRLIAGGESDAARLIPRLGSVQSEQARALAYRLYSICDRKKWADEALAYNSLVISWPAIQEKVASQMTGGQQLEMKV